jgi:hypothetical protein
MSQQDQQYVHTLMAVEYNRLLKQLNDFNINYAKYVKCNGAPNDLTCSQEDRDISKLQTLQRSINADIDTINNIINNKKSTGLKVADYNKNYSQIINNEEDVKKMRSELDMKMKEVYKIQDTIVNDSSLQYDSVMYTGVLFSILATSILYYTFTNL